MDWNTYLLIAATIMGVSLLGVTLYWFIQNLSSPELVSKVVPAMLLGVIGLFFTVWFSLKDEHEQSATTAALLAHATKMTPMEEIKHDYHKYYGGSLFSPRCFLNPIKGQELFDYHFYVVVTEIAEAIYKSVSAMNIEPMPTVFIQGKPLSLRVSKISWTDWVSYFASDAILYDFLNQINQKTMESSNMVLPTGTAVIFASEPGRKTIQLLNDFVDYKITIWMASGQRGLKEWQWILDIPEADNDSYWISKFNIHFETSYSKYKFGHKNMSQYHDWINTITKTITGKYDYSNQLRNALEYHHYLKAK